MKKRSENPLIEFFNSEAVQNKISEQDKKELASGTKQFKTDEVFIRKQLTSLTGVLPVINENDKQAFGITNLSAGAIPAEKNIVVDKIGMRFGYSATPAAPGTINYSNAIYNVADTDFDAGATATGDTVYARVIPSNIQNAEYFVMVDGNVVDSGRVEELLTQNVTNDGVNGHEKNYKMLEYPVLLPAGKLLTLDIKYPVDNAVVPAGNYFIEFIAKGLGLVKRSV
jgi:hypothetical protein